MVEQGAVLETHLLFQDEVKSIALVTISGEGRETKNLRSDLNCEVVSGEGYFWIDNRLRDVKEGAMVHIKKGTFYQSAGNLVMLVTAYPPFDPSFEVSIPS